jgi:hypothetical protein
MEVVSIEPRPWKAPQGCVLRNHLQQVGSSCLGRWEMADGILEDLWRRNRDGKEFDSRRRFLGLTI